jgi:hypothetical protein
VTNHALSNHTFSQFHLAKIPVHALHAEATLIETYLHQVFLRDDCSPESDVTDTESTERAALDQLNHLRSGTGFLEISWFPCVCHLLNLILKEFCRAGKLLLNAMTSLQNSLGHSAVFSYFCTERGLKKTTIPESNITYWSALQRMVESIVELRPTIREFLRTHGSFHLDDDVFVLAAQLKSILEWFRQLLLVMESDALGNINRVFCTLAAICKTHVDAPAN